MRRSTEGYAAFPGDCKPLDAAVHPDVEEVCNYIDDNCDGRIDERVKPTCGVGWCRRASPSCDAAQCEPGDPRPEECNAFDDDCDGDIDNGQLCAASMFRKDGTCVPLGLPESGTDSPDTNHNPSTSTSNQNTSCAFRALGEPAALGLLCLLAVGAVARRRKAAGNGRGRAE